MSCWPCISIHLSKKCINLFFLYTVALNRFLLEKLIVLLASWRPAHFVKPKISPCLLLPATCLCPEADQSSPSPPPCFLNICFIFTHLSMSGSSKLCVSMPVSGTYAMRKPFHHACYIPHISSFFGLSNKILRRLDMMILLKI